MKLFFIACHDQNGDSADAFVIADSRLQAVGIWSQSDLALSASEGDALVFEVPTSIGGVPRMLGWHTEIKEV